MQALTLAESKGKKHAVGQGIPTNPPEPLPGNVFAHGGHRVRGESGTLATCAPFRTGRNPDFFQSLCIFVCCSLEGFSMWV